MEKKFCTTTQFVFVTNHLHPRQKECGLMHLDPKTKGKQKVLKTTFHPLQIRTEPKTSNTQPYLCSLKDKKDTLKETKWGTITGECTKQVHKKK